MSRDTIFLTDRCKLTKPPNKFDIHNGLKVMQPTVDFKVGDVVQVTYKNSKVFGYVARVVAIGYREDRSYWNKDGKMYPTVVVEFAGYGRLVPYSPRSLKKL